MLKIYITRHGQNEDNANGILNGHRDLPLTAIGEKQGRELAGGIKEAGLTFDAVYSSPLSRAMRTAEIVSETLGMPKPVAMDLLIERDFGVMTGKPIADIEKLCAPDIVKADIITYFLSPAGAETFPDLLRRARRALDQIRAARSSGSILLVTHGDFGKMLYAAYYGLPWQDMLTKFHFGNCELLLLAEGADPDKPHVVRVEQHNH
ncbi:MAG TPA: histidine phosphatase family protein [Candidatus Paceibacterota bacterium]|nr:histidine phosphatase family protein [Candidatus Paceibacterota bacterium]